MRLDGIFNKLSEMKYEGSVNDWYQNNTETDKEDPLDEEPLTYISEEEKPETKPLIGECTLSIRIENHGQYLMWQKLNGGGNRQWEYVVAYPAIMRGVYSFANSMDVEVIAKKIVQLMQMGFDVYSAHWKLKEEEIKE